MSIKNYGKEFTDEVKKDLQNYFKDRDYMVIAVPEKEPIRVYALKATNTVRKAQELHGFPHIVAAAVGRAICGALLLTSLIKHATNQKILLRIDSDGAVNHIVVEADGHGRVRCFASYRDVDVETREVKGVKKLDIGKVIGKGSLTVIKDLGFGEPYSGMVPLVSGEIGEDIAYYLWKSEQIPSAVAVGVLIDETGRVQHAGGFLVQTLGETTPEALEVIEKRVKELPPISSLLKEGKRPEDIALMILEGLNPHLVGLKEVEYYCPCSQEVVKNLIKQMPEETLKEQLEEKGFVEVQCKFCNSVYRFTKEEVDRIRTS
ncbi:MAG: Hsp33 family molecular chaperone HslO [Deferribacteres bacterium]|nr:Hsp33 family molecular chaperone HslO [Deferribacteres bacterium]